MLERKIFVGKLVTVDALAAGAVELGEVSALDHEVFDDAMEDAVSVAA